MFEAALEQASVLKRIIDSIKDLVEEANFDCAAGGISMQAMDSSHVSLVSMLLRPSGFQPYRCDRHLSLGMHIGNLAKVIKCADNSDRLKLTASDDADVLKLEFESSKTEKKSNFAMKLMDIDTDNMTIPEKDYDAVIKMSSAEFQRVCRDLTVLGETVTIRASKDGVTFSAKGTISDASIHMSQRGAVDGKEEEQLTVELNQTVEQTFALNYLSMFSKATALSPVVSLSMAADTPLVVEYRIEDMGYIRFYLAFKIGEEDEEDSDDEGVKKEM